jgi:hypothetical protein
MAAGQLSLIAECDPSLARRAHLAETQSGAPQRRDDAGDEIGVGRDFDTHPFAAFELNFDGCQPSRGAPSPRWSYVLSPHHRRFLDHLDGGECQRRSNTRPRSSVADQPFGSCLPAPREKLAGIDAALPSYLRDRVAGTASLFNKLELLFLAPAPTALRPSQDFYPSAHRPCA